MCRNCSRLAAQRAGTVPKDLEFYATTGGDLIGGLLVGIVLSPFIVLYAVAVLVGWLADKVRP